MQFGCQPHVPLALLDACSLYRSRVASELSTSHACSHMLAIAFSVTIAQNSIKQRALPLNTRTI